MAIDTVFLDAGGVLVFPNWHRVAAALARHGLTTTAEALAAVEWRAKHEVDTGAAGQSDLVRGWLVFGRVFARAGVTGSDAAGRPPTRRAAARHPDDSATADAVDRAIGDLQRYHADHNLWERVPPDVIPALRRLRGAGRKLVVVSNANGRMRAALDRVGLGPHIDLVVDSFEEGVEKPNPQIFARALERIGARPTTTLHVGDLFHTDVVGARAAGLRAVLLDMADLYGGFECERVRSLAELADRLDGVSGDS
ncbi:MAG: HAD-IA family hydrolase [Deltaproteobacteria bacterium]|nr:HAD-IA family hydrolase [Deltaproteobacteria bacterium]